MQYIKELAVDTAKLTKYLREECHDDFSKSMLYSTATEEKVLDEELRLSEFRTIKTLEGFDCAQEIVDEINKKNKSKNYFHLLKNDLTHIRYKQGGFFHKHSDFLSLKSNFIEEYTLIICVTPEEEAKDCVGGETVVSFGDNYEFESLATTTPGRALLFRKDMAHRGNEVLQGTKEICTLNLWMTREKTTELLNIVFSSEAFDERGWEFVDDFDRPDSHRSYVLDVAALDDIPETIFSNFLRIEKAKREQVQQQPHQPRLEQPQLLLPLSSQQQIYTFECTVCSYEDFSLIYSILCRQPIDVETMLHSQDLLDYFGIDKHYLLSVHIPEELKQKVNRGNVQTGNEFLLENDRKLKEHHKVWCDLNLGNQDVRFQEYIDDKDVQLLDNDAYKKIKIPSAEEEKDKLAFSDQTSYFKDKTEVIVCENSSRTKFLTKMTQSLNLPYVPFTIFFAEGTYFLEGDAEWGTPSPVFSMMPIVSAFGDYNNLYQVVNMVTTDPRMNRYGFTNYKQAIENGLDEHQQTMMSTPNVHIKFTYDHTRADSVADTSQVVLPNDENGPMTKKLPASFDDCQHCEFYAEIYEPLLSYDLELSLISSVYPLHGDEHFINNSTCKEKQFSKFSQEITKSILARDKSILEGIILPGGNDVRADINNATAVNIATANSCTATAGAMTPKKKFSSFHTDSYGNICFSKKESEIMCRKIEENDLIGKIKAKIPTTPFVLPQQSGYVEDHFCNETVYGSFVFLMVTGLVRVSDDDNE